MVKKYVVTLKVNSTKDLATLFGAIDEFAEVVSTTMEEDKTRTRAANVSGPPRTFTRRVGVTGKELLLGILPCSMEKIMRAFIEKGYSPKSVSPAISTLKKDGKIYEKDGVWYKR